MKSKHTQSKSKLYTSFISVPQGKDSDGIYEQIGAPFVDYEDGLVDENAEGIQKVLDQTHVFIKVLYPVAFTCCVHFVV